MAWYEKGKLPEWRLMIDRPYSATVLLENKELILQELHRVPELQVFLKQHRDEIVGDLLAFCLQPPGEGSSYERKYAHPTRTIQLITNEFFLSALGLDNQALPAFLSRALEYFLKVDPHQDNVNLYHAYFERLLRGVINCRAIDKAQLSTAIQDLQKKSRFIERLFKHSHKLAVCLALELILTLDLMEPFVTLAIQFKQNIMGEIFSTLGLHSESLGEAERTENCLQVLKTLFERSINFLAARRSEPETPLTIVKMDTLFATYSLFQGNFPTLIKIAASPTESGIKVAVFELLQLNQIFLNQAETRARQFSPEWGLEQGQGLIPCMLGSRVSLTHPAFIDWLTISFAEIGQRPNQAQLLRRLGVLQAIVGLLLSHRGNNIISAKIHQFLKVIFHNIAEGEVIGCIQRSKITTNTPSGFILLHYALQSITPLQDAVRQFKSINDPLFVTLFTLFKLIAQYCRNIDSLLSLYGHVEGSASARTAVGAAIDFQRQQQCFQVFQREVAKDLGRFYSDEMFADQQPIDFTVRHLPSHFLPTPNTISEGFQPQTIITMPAPPVKPPSIIPQKEETKVQTDLIAQTLFHTPREPTVVSASIISQQNQQETSSQHQTISISSNYGSFVRDKLREVESNLPIMRRSKSRTPTKIKNQLKKAKNKWVTSNDADGESSDMGTGQRSLSEQKPPMIVMEQKGNRIILLRVDKARLRASKERLIDPERDKRLVRLLAGLNA